LDALNKDWTNSPPKSTAPATRSRLEAKPKLQALRDQAAQLNKQLDDGQKRHRVTWDSVKAGFSKAYDATKDGFNQARQWLKRQNRALRRGGKFYE